MIFRRDFLQRGSAALAGSLLPFPLWAGYAPPAPGSRLPLFRLIHDTRQRASLALVQRLGTQLLDGTAAPASLLYGVHGDVTRFWYDELQPGWQQQRTAVAGATAPDVLFCLEQLARDHQLRVLWRQEHAGEAGQPLVSWLIAAD